MPIEFLDLLDADDAAWVPYSPPEGSPAEGSPVEGSPGPHLDGEAWQSTRIDPSFGLTGIRLAPGTTVASHRHNRSLLLLVFDGSLEVTHHELDDDPTDETTVSLRAAQFCVIDADTVHRLTAGPDGATYLSSWPLRAPELETNRGPATDAPTSAQPERRASRPNLRLGHREGT